MIQLEGIVLNVIGIIMQKEIIGMYVFIPRDFNEKKREPHVLVKYSIGLKCNAIFMPSLPIKVSDLLLLFC